MGKFQLNKKGEDPIKIYEDTFKIAEGTVETHLDKLGKQPKPISRESDDTSRFEADIENDQLIQKLPTDKRSFNVESDGTDHDNDGDIDSEDYLKSRDIAIKSNIEEADNFPQKDFGSVNQWEDDLDELRGLGGKLPDTNALWNSVEAIASEDIPSGDCPKCGHKKGSHSSPASGDTICYGSSDCPCSMTFQPEVEASGYTGRNWDSRSDIEQQADVDQKIKNVLDGESYASEDYGNMNTVQNPDSDSDGYPMDQEGYTRANWDDASIQDRKNWLFVAGYDSERGDEYKPYFSLDSHIRAQLAKDLQIGGIYAMGTGSL